MSFFRRPDYQSEATQFINKLKADKPELDGMGRVQRRPGGAAALRVPDTILTLKQTAGCQPLPQGREPLFKP